MSFFLCLQSVFNKLKAFVDYFIRSRAIMRSFKTDQHFSSLESIIQSLGMILRNECIVFSVDETYLLFRDVHQFKALDYVHRLYFQSWHWLDFTFQATENAREKHMKKATASTRYELRRWLFTEVSEVRISWICDHYVAFLTFEQTHSPHTSPPTNYFVSLIFEVLCSSINIFTLVLAQGNVVWIFSNPTTAEIKASKADLIR